MDASEAFKIALGIASPFFLDRVELLDGTLHLHVDFVRGELLDGCRVHDSVERSWRHGDFFQYRCEVHAKVPRVIKPDGSVKTLEVPWARKGSGFTSLFEAQAVWLCRQMTVHAAAKYLRVHDTRLWRLLGTYVESGHAKLDYSNLKRIGVDETAARRGHDYITVFVDLDERRVVFACQGRSGVALANFRAFLESRNISPTQIEEFACDMSPAFLSGIREAFPRARVTLDKFHLVAMLSKAVDDTRKEESKTFKSLKGTRYLWLRNPSSLSEQARETLRGFLRQSGFTQTAQAYAFRLQFQEIFGFDKRVASRLFDAWLDQVLESGLKHVEKVATTFFGMRQLILNWFDTKISNGILEGLHSVLQATKNKARGYKNPDNLITMSYLLHAKLMPLPL